MNFAELLLGQIPEALYFALFMILSKKLKTKKLLYASLMCVEYILLLHIFPFNIWSRISYFAISYIILKLLYKERAQITDIFTMGIASLLLLIINIILFFAIKNNLMFVIIDRILLFLILFLLRNKLPKIQDLYKKFWNRNKIPKHMKSTTFRALNAVIFNFMFYIINMLLLYYLCIGR